MFLYIWRHNRTKYADDAAGINYAKRAASSFMHSAFSIFNSLYRTGHTADTEAFFVWRHCIVPQQKSPHSYTQVARGEVYEPAYSAVGVIPFTAMRLGWALALLGTRTVKIPLALVALI